MPASLIHHTFGPFLAQFNVDPEFVKKLLQVGKKLKTKWNHRLVGRIQYERLYNSNEEWIVKGFGPYVQAWMDGWKKYADAPEWDKTLIGWKFVHLWCNIQKAGEYNPIHTHSGCDLSCVLFAQLPKNMNKEPRQTNNAPNGSLSFIYGEESELAISDRVLTPVINTLFICPAKLRHHVTSFTSKGERISIAGNIRFIHKPR